MLCTSFSGGKVSFCRIQGTAQGGEGIRVVKACKEMCSWYPFHCNEWKEISVSKDNLF